MTSSKCCNSQRNIQENLVVNINLDTMLTISTAKSRG